jgi:hypothetical protein
MTQSYSSEEEEYLDDDFLDQIDPHANARWDKVEGPKERAAYCLKMEERLSPNKNTIEDKIILEIIELVKEFDDIFAQTPKAPGMSDSVEHRIETTGPPRPRLPLCTGVAPQTEIS